MFGNILVLRPPKVKQGTYFKALFMLILFLVAKLAKILHKKLREAKKKTLKNKWDILELQSILKLVSLGTLLQIIQFLTFVGPLHIFFMGGRQQNLKDWIPLTKVLLR